MSQNNDKISRYYVLESHQFDELKQFMENYIISIEEGNEIKYQYIKIKDIKIQQWSNFYKDDFVAKTFYINNNQTSPSIRIIAEEEVEIPSFFFLLHTSDHEPMKKSKSHFEISKATRDGFWINLAIDTWNNKNNRNKISSTVVFFKHGNCPAYKRYKLAIKYLKKIYVDDEEKATCENVFLKGIETIFKIFDDTERQLTRKHFINGVLAGTLNEETKIKSREYNV